MNLANACFQNLRRLLCLAFALATLALTSCFQNESTVKLKKDGSGTVVESVYVSPMVTQMMGGLAGELGGGDGKPPEMFKEEDFAKRAPTMGEGVTLASFKSNTNAAGWTGVTAEYAFPDINKLILDPSEGAAQNLNPGGMGGAGGLGGGAPSKPDPEKAVRFSYQGDTLKVLLPKPDAAPQQNLPPAGSTPELPDDPTALAMMSQMFQGARMTMKIEPEGGVAKSDADHQDGKSVTLVDMDFGAMMKDPSKFGELQKLGEGASLDQVKEIFGDVEGMSIESKEEISVKLR